MLPVGTAMIDRHELIAGRGVACDRVVDTQVPQDSIYALTGDGERRYTDTDAELFGLEPTKCSWSGRRTRRCSMSSGPTRCDGSTTAHGSGASGF